jgi:hypothetical protein
VTLRIENYADGRKTVIRLSGRLQSTHLDELNKQIESAQSRIALDLSGVVLVDVEVVRFLMAARKAAARHRSSRSRSAGKPTTSSAAKRSAVRSSTAPTSSPSTSPSTSRPKPPANGSRSKRSASTRSRTTRSRASSSSTMASGNGTSCPIGSDRSTKQVFLCRKQP